MGAVVQIDRNEYHGRWIFTDGKAHAYDSPEEVGTQVKALCGWQSSRRRERVEEQGDPRCYLCEVLWRRHMHIMNRGKTY